MKTLADFKRTIKRGQKWSGYHHIGHKDLGIREVVAVLSNAFAFQDPNHNRPSWCDFPKAKDIEVMGDTVKICQGKTLVLTYKLEAT